MQLYDNMKEKLKNLLASEDNFANTMGTMNVEIVKPRSDLKQGHSNEDGKTPEK